MKKSLYDANCYHFIVFCLFQRLSCLMIILSGVLLLIIVALPQMNSAKMRVKRFLN